MKDEKKTSFFKKLFGQKPSCCALEIEEIDPNEEKNSLPTNCERQWQTDPGRQLRFDPPFLKRGLIRQVQTHDYEGTVDGDPNSPTTGQGHPGDRQADGTLQEHGAKISPRWPGRAAAGIARETGK